MKKSLITLSVLVIGFVLGASALSVFAQTWTAPAGTPPGNNTLAPLNVGYSGQIKDGNIWIKGLISAGVAAQYGLVVESAPIKAMGGLIIETRTDDPASPETGMMWLRTDL